MKLFGKKKSDLDRRFEEACIEQLDNLYAAALRLCHNSTAAEELVQDTYLRAFRFKDKFEWGTNLKAWLFRIQTNTFINEYRHRQYEQRYQDRIKDEPLYDEVLDSQARAYAANPENHLFNRFFEERLSEALQTLPDDFRQVVVLSDLEGFSYREISEMLDTPIGTVMSRLHRGRKALQRELVDYAAEVGVGPGAATDLAQYRRKRRPGK